MGGELEERDELWVRGNMSCGLEERDELWVRGMR
jgi:hypothetical protein